MTELVAPCYIIVSGVQTNQGIVITRYVSLERGAAPDPHCETTQRPAQRAEQQSSPPGEFGSLGCGSSDWRLASYKPFGID